MALELRELARRMLMDYDDKTPGLRIDGPVDLNLDRAYALQAEITRLREARGERVVGYKIGCTSKPIRAQLGVQEPIFGRLFDVDSHPSDVLLSSSRYANLAVEGELALRLAADLPGEAPTAVRCREAVAAIFPVIELHNYVIPETWLPGPWLIASNGLHAGWVRAEDGPRGSGTVDDARSLSVRINEVVVGSIEDAASLTDPMESLRWLAGRLARFGLPLLKGQVILTGSPLRLFPVSAGSRIVVDAPPLGTSRAAIAP